MKKYQKIASLFLVVVMVFVMMPQVSVAAEDGYAYEIVVEPNPVVIGDEVTVTVRLTDYDETRSGIRGFQIDITNTAGVLQNSVCRSLVNDKENLISDVAAYQPARDLVRHLYAKMTGTMSYSDTELLEVKIPLPDTYTEDGVISLPFRILIQNAAGGKFTYNSTVEIPYVKDAPIESVDITWGAMDFTYQEGQWQPSNHSYAEGEWVANDDSNTFTVANNGGSAVTAHISYVTERTDISGKFSDGTTVTDEMTATIESKKSKNGYLILEGRPSEEMGKQKIGTVTVTLK